jgi:hypothetical protein
VREWRRIGYEASVGCSGVGGAWNLGVGRRRRLTTASRVCGGGPAGF